MHIKLQRISEQRLIKVKMFRRWVDGKHRDVFLNTNESYTSDLNSLDQTVRLGMCVFVCVTAGSGNYEPV